MSELVVVAYRDAYRGLQVSGELRRVSRNWVDDLDRAVVLSWEHEGRVVVQQTVNLSTGEGAKWGTLWGSFIRTTLMSPHTDDMTAAATSLLTAVDAQSFSPTERRIALHGFNWWLDEIGLSCGFVRDIGALIQPGDSALFLLLANGEAPTMLKQLPNYGGVLLHENLDAFQDAKLQAFLEPDEPESTPG